MRVLFLNRSYYPDIEATGQLLSELCADLSIRHDITVIAGQPNFITNGKKGGLIDHSFHEGVDIVRVRNLRFDKKSLLRRGAGLISYLFLAFWAALWQRRPDVIVVETDPPILGVMGLLLKRWHRCSLVFYLQDLFPEVGLILGHLKPGLLTFVLRWITQITLDYADRVVVLGEDMKQRVVQRGVEPAKIAIVPNWADVSALKTNETNERNNSLRKEWGLEDRFVVMYSGNLGLSQNLSQVLDAAEMLQGERAAFVFVGEGAAKERLMSLAAERKLDNVQFQPYQPKNQLGLSLAAADVHLIPLQRGLAGYIVPSKLYGILAVSRPYIASVDEESEVALITHREKTGLRIEPDSPTALANAIRWCLTHRKELAEMGRRGGLVAESYFDRRRSVSLFALVLKGLEKPERKVASDSAEGQHEETGYATRSLAFLRTDS
ncbi:MAG: glycosyltransferase family 4 protein [Gemmataceae bacterium]